MHFLFRSSGKQLSPVGTNQLTKAMKLTMLLLTVAFLQVSASGVSQTVTYSGKNVSLRTIFKVIKNQTGYTVFCKSDLLQATETATVNLQNADIRDAMNEVLDGQPLEYSIIGETIVIKRKRSSKDVFSEADSTAYREITGTVKDAQGRPLTGVSVILKGTTTGTSTGAGGTFTIDANPTDVLEFSFVGYRSKAVTIGQSTHINVVLEIQEVVSDEVVVVGYGKASKANLTTSQVGISSKQMDETVNTTVAQAIQGRAAGVYVTQNTGQPGGGISVNIRGISSLNGTQPLYVIDGVQTQSADVDFGNASTSNPLSGLNPSDIADIQILQGPSATAIYGSRGTNGVVLITTKRGKAGDFKIGYEYQYSLQTPPHSLPMMNLKQYAQMVIDYHQLASGTTPEEFLDPSLLGKGTDWQKELFNNAAMNKHQVNLSGGSNNTTYYLSGEYLNQDGVALGSGFDRYSFRLNLDNKPREWATIGVNLNYNQTKENLAATNYSDAESPLIANALRLTPQIPVTNLDGSWGGSDPVNGANQWAPVNPIALANLITNNNKKRQFMGGLNVSITPAKGLTVRTSFNGSAGNGISTYFKPTYNIDQWHFNTVASLDNNTYTTWYWNWNQLIEYTRQIDKHNFTIMASHEAQESEWKALNAGRTGFLTNDIFDVNAGDPVSATNSGGTYPWSMESYLGRATYNFDNRYIVMGTFRRDGSPNFGSEKRWGNFPSVSAAWRVNNEKFFTAGFITDLKLRFETGLTGNQGSGSGIYAPMATGATPWGTGFIPSTFTNPKLQWEATHTNNFGIDIAVLNNRISLQADYYVKKTDDLILQASLPWYMGTNPSPGSVGAPLVNTGSLKTNGWSFTINSTNIQKSDFRWESSLNLSHFDTKILSLNSDNAFIDRISWWMNNWTQRAAIGSAPWLFRGYIQEGIFQSVDEISKSAVPVDNNGDKLPVDAATGIWVGDAKYKDISGDGKITVDDVTDIGNPWPKLSGGFTNTFSYKGFNLSILITGSYGNDIYNFIAAQASNPNNVNLSRNFLTNAIDYAKITTNSSSEPVLSNPGTNIPRITNNQLASDNNYGKNTTRFVEDGSYLRLKNISLTYNLPSNLLGFTRVMKGLKATAGVQNIYTLTHYSGYDPEIGAYVGTGSDTNNQAIGIDFGRYPLTPMYTLTINANF